MFKRKIMLSLFIILALLISISMVSADENLTSTDDGPVIADKNFEDLQDKIDNASESETVNIEEAYSSIDKDVTINKSITLNGIGDEAKIEAGYNHGLNITSKSVTLQNLKLDTRINANNSTLTLINCTFAGAINNIEGNVAIINSTFLNGLNCYAKNLNVENSTFNGGYSAIYGENTEFNRCTFNETSMDNYNEKTILENSIIISESQLKQFVFFNTVLFEISNCEISNINIYNSGNLTLNINKTKLNKARISNHGIEYGVFNANIFNSIFNESNIGGSNNLNINDCSFYSSTVQNNGNLTVKNSNFTDTTGIDGYGKTIVIDNSNFDKFAISIGDGSIIHITNSNFTKVFSIEITYYQGSVYLDNCSFTNIKSDYNLIDSKDYTVDFEITNCRFTNNTCDRIISQFFGKNVYNNNTFINNTCSYLIYWSMNLIPEVNGNANEAYVFELNNNIFISNYDLNNNISKIHIEPPYSTKEITYTDEYGNQVKTHYYAKIYNNKNFYGFNVENTYGIQLLNIFEYPASTYKDTKNINLDLTNNTLRFIDENNNIVSMPDSTFTIINKTSKEVIVDSILVKNGEGKFTYGKTLTLDDVYVLNEASEIVNKPEAEVILTKTGTNFYDTNIIVTIKNGNDTIVGDNILVIADRSYNDAELEDQHSVTIKKNSANGTEIAADYLTDGALEKLDIEVYFINKEFGLSSAKLSNITVKKISATAKLSDITVTYNAAKTVEIKVYEANTNSLIKNRYGWTNYGFLKIGIYKNNKLVKMYHEATKKGVLSYKIPKLDAGTYKIIITSESYSMFNVAKKTVTLTVNKKKVTVKAPKVTNKFKKAQYFKVTAKNMKNLKIKVKVYTGKKSKTYTIKTNAKGVAKLNTKPLKVGKHKVEISSGDNNYKITAKSTITIKR